ncbi:NlpC/P60 family protein [Streptomyces sp. NPDC048192]|uniref:aggregation-promoting factor C-terminal-like domain-containing protein n=1 Tax=Streptomyces sp. NPDC048192 TaxID=3365510 RepID=UPI0037118D9D
MTSGTHTAPAGRGLPLRVLTGLLAAVLALLAAVTVCPGPHDASAARPAAAPIRLPARPDASAPAALRADHPAPAVGRPHAASRSAARPVTHHTARTIRLRPGDTLWSLARRYGTTVAALQHTNHLGTSSLIYAGGRLNVPASARPAAGPGSGHPRRHHAAPAAPGAAAAVAFARRQLGLPYRWGGSGDGAYDCSGLVQAAWRAAGVMLPRTTAAQARAGVRIARSQLRPGDLVFTAGYGHVQLYAGQGRVIEAAHPGTRVRTASLPPASLVDGYRRPAALHRIIQATDHRPTAPAAVPVTARAAAPTAGSVRAAAAGVFGSQYACAAYIIARESAWKTTAANPASGAYGLAQALPGSKMARYGSDWRTNPVTQLRWMRAYVTTRYGGACAAWAFWQTHHWY